MKYIFKLLNINEIKKVEYYMVQIQKARAVLSN